MSKQFVIQRTTEKQTRFLIIIAIAQITIASGGFIYSMIMGTSSFTGMFFAFLFNGVAMLWNAIHNKKMAPYFISWDNEQLKFLLPKSKEETTISLSSIDNVSISEKYVTLTLQNGEQHKVNYSPFYFPERQEIIDYFKAMQ